MNKTPARQNELTDRFRHAAGELRTVLTEGLDDALGRLHRHWTGGMVDGQPPKTVPISALCKCASGLIGGLPLLQEWVALQRTLLKCATVGLMPCVSGLGSISATDAPKAFERRFYTLWASALMADSDVLTTFSAEQREELVRRFRSLDTAVRGLAALYVQGKAAEPARRLRAAQARVNGSEVELLRRELQKRRRIK